MYSAQDELVGGVMTDQRLTSDEVLRLYRDIYASINRRIDREEKRVELDENRRYVSVGERGREDDEARVQLDFYIEAIEEKLREIEGMSLMRRCMAAIEFVQYLCRVVEGPEGGYYFNSLTDTEKMEIASVFCRKLSVRY